MSLGGARPRLPRARHHGNGTQDLFSLQAATLRAAVFYERLGFRRMRAEDVPLALVPPGDAGWSPEILRVAAGRPGPRERAMPWLVLEPSHGFAAQPRFTAAG